MAAPIERDPNYWVLSIDDDPFLRLGLQNALDQTKDIELLSASTKAEGMKLFVEMWNGSSKEASRKPNLVLLDQDLQGGDKGTDLLNDIVEFCGGTPQDAAKVCMLSASQRQRDWVKAFELGAIGWIDKAAIADLNDFPGRLKGPHDNTGLRYNFGFDSAGACPPHHSLRGRIGELLAFSSPQYACAPQRSPHPQTPAKMKSTLA